MRYKGFDTKHYSDPKFWLFMAGLIAFVFILDKLF